MLAAVREYEAERARFNASEDPDEDADFARLAKLGDRLERRPPAIRSRDGAIAALDLAIYERTHVGPGGFIDTLLARASCYFGVRIGFEQPPENR